MMKHYDYYAVTNLPTYVKPFGSVELTIAGVTKNYTFWFGTNGTKKIFGQLLGTVLESLYY